MRLADWQSRYSEFGKARMGMPFAWGLNDCCTFAAAAVEALTGVNPMAGVQPYSTEIGALRRITDAGGLNALASQYLGPSVSPMMAGVGDVVLIDEGGREMLCVCNGTSVMAPSEQGMAALGIGTAIAAWKI